MIHSRRGKRSLGARVAGTLSLAMVLAVDATGSATAANITWAKGVDETGHPSEVVNAGKLLAAVTAGLTTTVNGVKFESRTPLQNASSIRFGAAPITVESAQNPYGEYGGPPENWEAGYRSLVTGGAYSESPASPMKIQIHGLKAGNKYLVQIFEAFWNANFATVFVGGRNASDALNLSGPARNGSGNSATPQFVIGTFVADSDEETIALRSATGYVVFDAIQVRDLSPVK